MGCLSINWLSIESLINNWLIRGLTLSINNWLIVGNHGQGMRSCKCTNHDLYVGGCQWCQWWCQWQRQVCVSDTMVSVCMSRCVCVCLSSCSLLSWIQGTCLAHITSIKAQWCPGGYTTSHFLRNPHYWSSNHNQVLSDYADQERELLHTLVPPHQRVCVKGNLPLQQD